MLLSDQINVKLVSYSKNPKAFTDFMICVEVVADVNSKRAVYPIFMGEGLEELMNDGGLDDYFVKNIRKKYMNAEID